MVDMAVSHTASERSLSRQAWFMVGAAMLGTMCCSTSVILANVGVFIKPLGDAFAWDRGPIVLALSIAAISMAAANPFVGGLIDRFGVKPVLITSLFSYGLFVAATPALVGAFEINGLYLAYAAIAGFGAGSNVIAYVRLLSGWFSGPMGEKRGLALGISSAGIPLGTTITGPLGIIAIESFGWQGGYWVLSLLPLAIGVPLALFMIKQAPSEERSVVIDGQASQRELPGMSMPEVLRTQSFWLLMAIALLMSCTLQGIGIHIVPMISDFNVSVGFLTFIVILDGVLGIGARIAAGFLFDKYHAPHVSMVIFAVAGASAFAFAAEPTLLVAVIATVFITLGSGAESDFIGYVIGRYFGLRCYGRIFGAVYAMFMVGIAAGPYLFGVAYDTWGSYQIPFLIAGLGISVICVLMALLPRFETEAKH